MSKEYPIKPKPATRWTAVFLGALAALEIFGEARQQWFPKEQKVDAVQHAELATKQEVRDLREEMNRGFEGVYILLGAPSIRLRSFTNSMSARATNSTAFR
jgi:outer membrane protein assembly factor BamE (lipoprotein component of BamABCDE complex)